MHSVSRPCLLLAIGLAPMWVSALDVPAGTATDLAVTVYRAPVASPGSMDLDRLGGFALVSETRTVSVPAGESRLRFEGVADGIESTSAIITGLPAGALEKNRDARVLSPSALVAATLGRSVLLVRSRPRTGRPVRIAGKIRSDAGGGVVFESAEGIEALRCSGLPETFSFSGTAGLAPTPTLSTLIRSPAPVTATVTLSYLAHGFDWSASYVASVSPDGTSMDIGAWVTLANANAVSFPAAHTQVIAGRLNRETREIEPLDLGHAILAQCWPRGTTSDLASREMLVLVTQARAPAEADAIRSKRANAASLAALPPVAQLVEQEQLGDLKLYRVPERTTVASRQIKQVRLLDRQHVPVQQFYGADLQANQNLPATAAHNTLRTKNDAAHHLGLPLPSGTVDSLVSGGGDAIVLLSETALRDVAVDEEFEIEIGRSSDVQVSALREQARLVAVRTEPPALLPGVQRLQSAVVDDVSRVDIRNARDHEIAFELRLRLADGTQLVGAEPAPGTRDGRPLFKLTVPAGASTTIRYQTEHSTLRAILR